MRRLWMLLLMSLTLTLLSVALLTPASAQSSVGWAGEYFNGAPYIFTGTAGFTQTTSSLNAISLSWTGSPGGSIGADNWSARWTANAALGANTYRFALRADRSARLYVNNSLLINLDSVAVGTTVTADLALAGGIIPMRIEYYDDTGDGFLQMNFAVSSTVPPAATATTAPTSTGSTGTGGTTTNQWSVSYYANTSLSGNPALTATLGSPNVNFGTGSPGAGVPSDGFSARFTATENFTAGVYRFDVSADDGVRVTVGGQRVIDHWYVTDSNLTYTANVVVSGATSVTIEYFENTLGASLFYNVTRVADNTTPSTSFGTSDPRQTAPQQTYTYYAMAKVIAGRLNVREQPTLSSRIVTKLNFGEYYSVIGSNADRSWYQLQIGNITGWAAGTFLRLESQGSVPQTAPTDAQSAVANPFALPPGSVQPVTSSAPSPSGYSLVTTANTIIRSQPTVASSRNGLIPAGFSTPILGRNSTNTWWYINFSFQEGWINASYALVSADMNINAIPVLSQ
jgi:uncharacterized protein YgiM (DUF1202 family)